MDALLKNPPPPDGSGAASRGRQAQQYVAKIAFTNGRETPPFPIAAFDFTGAMAKLTGMASDQPGTILTVQLALVVAEPLIQPASAGVLLPGKPANGAQAEAAVKNFRGRTRGQS